NKSVKEIKEIEVEDFFAKLGLGEHLSPSRRNGMMSMVDKIKFYANNA
ncbi:MAG: SufE family protein, partial [Alphaproteobacteria bacterium]|nr:SufE family protein [Alphaproteobacteria bacterium]